MYCTECGGEVKAGWQHCEHCGGRLLTSQNVSIPKSGRLKFLGALGAVVVLLWVVGALIDSGRSRFDSGSTPSEQRSTTANDPAVVAKRSVARYLGWPANELGVTSANLAATENPQGEGYLVYSKRTRFSGVSHAVAWLVLDGTPYSLNETTEKYVTPILSSLSEADSEILTRSGFDESSPQDAISALVNAPAIEKAKDVAVWVVARRLRKNNKLGVKPSDLRATANPHGEGHLVYSQKTMYSGVRRLLIWAVLDGIPYPLNGTSKDLIPSLSWPRDVSPRTWERTGLNPRSPGEALSYVFGGQ